MMFSSRGGILVRQDKEKHDAGVQIDTAGEPALTRAGRASRMNVEMAQHSDTGGLRFSARHRARLVLFAFLLTFISSRIVTVLIMGRRIPDLYLHLGGTHIHHLNYGIFLLAAIGAYLLFGSVPPQGLSRASVIYGIGLALTFDEFGMWLTLGRGYWQRASFDAVIVLAALLGLASFAPPLRHWRPHHIATAILMLGAALLFYFLLAESFRFAAFVYGVKVPYR
jgi:hypothetical protein